MFIHPTRRCGSKVLRGLLSGGDSSAYVRIYAASCKRTSQNSPSRDCLENSRRVLDRLCFVLQESEMGCFRPVLATRYTPNRGLLGLSRQSLTRVLGSSRQKEIWLVLFWDFY